jgi:hypothetical protein
MKQTIKFHPCPCFSVVPLHAQSRGIFNRISVDDGLGLASNRVYCLHQDSKGYIWVERLTEFKDLMVINLSVLKAIFPWMRSPDRGG